MRSLHAELRLLVGTTLDRVEEIVFCLRNRPIHMAHLQSTVTREVIDKSIALGSGFLAKHQLEDGSFRGFLLYPGISTSWITAHIAFVIENVFRLTDICFQSAKYLSKIGPEDGGWGFNKRVGIDCDSSSQALMVLHRFSLPIPEFLIRNIVAAQSSCGGFPTYVPSNPDGSPANGWQTPHPEVTGLVIEMLHRLGRFESEAETALTWLKGQLIDGILPSYWFDGPSYGLWVQARTGFMKYETSEAARRIVPYTDNMPDLPMILVAAMGGNDFDEVIVRGVSHIISAQHADGSWPCRPFLRVTHPNQYYTSQNLSGSIHRDKRRIFSTAHSIAALVRARECLIM